MTMRLSSDPLISCVMPTYGRPAYVNEAVAMFLAQDYPRKELIVLNDCAGQRFVFDHPDVHVINRDERYGTLGEKRNAAIELAHGEIIAVWDDDDVYLPWRLSFSLAQMRQHDTPFYRPAEYWAWWGNDDGFHNNRALRDWMHHGPILFTRDVWQRAGGYPDMNMREDTEFSDRVQRVLDVDFIRYPLATHDRFFVLRGKSQYAHMSMGGGEAPLDTSADDFVIQPTDIQDERLRLHRDRLIEARLAAETPILSVCVSLRNRSRIIHDGQPLHLFPNCVRSLAEAAEKLGPTCLSGRQVELVVADFHSDDWPLDEWIPDTADPLQVNVIPVDGDFSRGRGLNIAARHTRSDRLFLCDADMLIPAELLQRGIEILDAGDAFFPVFRYLGLDASRQHLVPESFGNAMVTRELFEATGGVPEFHSWGGEDDLFYAEVVRRATVRRDVIDGFDHQWHPERCRHEHYRRPRRQDYDEHVAAR